MSRILNAASVAAVSMTTATILFLAEPGFASDMVAEAPSPLPPLAEVQAPETAETAGSDEQTTAQAKAAEALTQKAAQKEIAAEEAEAKKAVEEAIEQAPITAKSLAALVATTPRPKTIDSELRCLAGAVYFESRGESLPGQLAVAHVVINRAQSSRFPNSLCGVVYQRSQFSFVRGGKMPRIREGSQQWTRALAIAQIALNGSWKNHAPGALFFHADYVSPGWRKQRIAQIDNHIFYR
ncbi:cell wall hydrolase [Sphingopyxis sp. MWB1]|uniref:cell wall hydrolase n=1 Tax=Sphingopyxis sp. MWB1 TaxID=1537715 RepID=UPI000519F8AE|nr:cell wall hydrolase [Sphingopyxis sp. MWB1]